MLQNPSEDIRNCYLRADECRQMAQTAATELARADFLKMTGRWLALARSYEVTERLSAFKASFEARYSSKE
jgi:hypothetical protein